MIEFPTEEVFRLHLLGAYRSEFQGPPRQEHYEEALSAISAFEAINNIGTLLIINRINKEISCEHERSRALSAVLLPLVSPQYDQLCKHLDNTAEEILSELADSADRILTLLKNVQHPDPDLPSEITKLVSSTDLYSQLKQLRAFSTASHWPKISLTKESGSESEREKEEVFAVEPFKKKHKLENSRMWVVSGERYTEVCVIYRPSDWSHSQLITVRIGTQMYRLYVIKAGEKPPTFLPATFQREFDIQPLQSDSLKNSKSKELVYLKRVVARLNMTSSFRPTALEAEDLLATIFDKYPERSQIDAILSASTKK